MFLVLGCRLSPAGAAPITLTDMFVGCEEASYRHFRGMFEDKHLDLKRVEAMGKFIDAGIAGGICHRFNVGDTIYVDKVKEDLSCVRLKESKICFWAVTRTIR